MPAAELFVVATPIGNLEDITLRALRVLSEVDVIAAEDTRRTRILLSRHGIDAALTALHEHNEEQQAPQLVERLKGGESIALVSDAGTPLLSDPGFRLVRLASSAGVRVVTVPGPSAVTAALSISGLPTDRFCFEGFLPQRSGARRKCLQALSSELRTIVLFESAHRISESLADIAAMLGGDRQMALCREMTKQFETVLRGTAEAVRQQVEADADQRKGEFVLVIAGRQAGGAGEERAAVELAGALLEYMSASQAARVAAKIHGVPRRAIYAALKNSSGS